ncbi:MULTISPECIES: hypothetical protein [unclassified Duganella]|uniref:hypothetical protein n=1 Tax=unclassified Duganella TaxID=2636909 RepID=UPI0006FBF411|nr:MULTISPECIES: hypothetical protein [unclassified Duganella]KQV45905.1 hypothetical protein ASD07_15535 [Duganella sp. Root336D2]KRC03781.1 hypothetical protein ASE26_02835 [Duganella sp. Root198D2]
MFFIRYNWTLPFKAQVAIAIALVAVLASVHGSSKGVKDFAALHHNRCVQQNGSPGAKACSVRTTRLAARMHGAEFGGQVAAALR